MASSKRSSGRRCGRWGGSGRSGSVRRRVSGGAALVLSTAALAVWPDGASAAPFMAGADISALSVWEQRGARYYVNGQRVDLVEAFRDQGVNWFRLRLFVNPNYQDIVVNDLNYTIALAQRIKAAGGKLLLDFHYSDTWADPARQTKPAAWTSLSFSQLTQQVRTYSFHVIQTMKNAGVLPDMVQVGNEISNGMLWPEGYVWTGGSHNTGFNNLATLLNAAIAGIKEAAGAGQEPLIMIHHDKGADWVTSSYFFNKLVVRNVPFDVIGYSYYPKYHYDPATGKGSVADVRSNLINTAQTFGKPVIIVEAGFASRGAQWEPTYEFPVSVAGQQAFLQALVDAVRAVPSGRGWGVFWWYPEAVPLAGYSVWEGGRYGLFDASGNLLPTISVFTQATTPDIPGDLDLDGDVDQEDLAILLSNWGRSVGAPRGNLDKVGTVNDFDLNILLASWTGRGSAAGSVPEPGLGGVLAWVIGWGVLSRRMARGRPAGPLRGL